jgi:hypothetical protein
MRSPMRPTVIGFGETFSDAGWAFSTLLAAYFAQRFSG